MLSLFPGVSLLCSFAAAPALAPAPPAAQSVNTSPATPVLRYRAPDVELVAVSPRDPDLVVAVYDTSISHGPSGVALVRSEDGGATFQALDAQAIFPVVARARHLEFSWTGALYLADETSLYRSTDRGASFVQVHEIPGGEIRDLALDPFDGDRVFVAAVASDGSSADTHSTDAGSTWASTPLPPGTPAHHTTEFAVFDVAAPNRLLRARHYGRFSITDVSGQNVHASFPWTLGLGAGLGGVALIGDRVLVSGGSLYVSEDCGASFTAVPGLERIRSSVVVHPLRPNQMVALSEPYYLDPYSSTADSRRFGSNDEGRSWFQLDAGRFDNDLNSNAVVIAPRQSVVDDVRECTLLTGHPGGLTIGRAGTETPVSVPLPAGSFPVDNASIDRENADVWIHPPHGNGYRRFWTYTLDRGATWRRVSAPMAAGCHAVRVQGDGGVVLRCYGEFFSVDSGGVLTQGPLSASGLGHPIAGFDEVDLLSLNGHLAVTLDMWQSWYWVDDLPPLGFSIDRQWIDGKIRRVPGGVEVLSRKSQMLYLIGNRCTHQVTSDLGVTWRVIPEAGSMGSMTWNEIEPDVVYASDNDPTTSTRRSVDGGVTWTPVGSAASAPSIARGNLDPNLVVRGIDESGSSALGNEIANRYEISRDGGQTWTDLGVDLSGTSLAQFRLGQGSIAQDDTYLLIGPYTIELAEEIGAPECTANPNSTGAPASISAIGSTSVARGDVLLRATDVPPFAFGLFSTSQDAGFVPNVAGSDGNLCLAGAIGRLWPMPIRASGGGVATLRVDVDAIPQGVQLVPIQAGETWRYELWFRDGTTSNRTNAVAVTFVP